MPSKAQIPGGWQMARLGDVAEVVMGQSPPGTTVFDRDDQSNNGSGLPFVQGNAEFDGRFPVPVKWCVKPAKIAKPGDVLISVRAPVGETNLADQPLCIGAWPSCDSVCPLRLSFRVACPQRCEGGF